MAVLIAAAQLRPGVGAWFTGRDRSAPSPLIGAAGNLAHRRPHAPAELAAARREVGDHIGFPPSSWHLMSQVHGADVAVVTTATPVGAELTEVDGAVTTEAGRPLVVQVADCVPVLLAGPTTVGVAHAGRAGTQRGVVAAVVAAMGSLGDAASTLSAVIGPAIGGCCYEVPAALQAEVAADVPGAVTTTTWGTPSLDLPKAVAGQLAGLGLPEIDDVGACTRCDPEQRYFSHRSDPATGRQVGIVVRTVPA